MAHINNVHDTLRKITPGVNIIITVSRPGYRAFQNVKIAEVTVVEYDDETLIDPVSSTSFAISTPYVIIPPVFGNKVIKHASDRQNGDRVAYVTGKSIRFVSGYDANNNPQWTSDYDIVDARQMLENEY
ncbi:hypothetical protein EXVG_00406 [Emiliania huxleyi virus 202]|nr:hypothetical protein EXVG_00406 [Emiliania huxleyi virus 202]AHA54364.1 hypothetical protein EhV18_00318 [Emiliania huxleyi virus 18]AHA55403.1 hypothetical protein EhV156_00308 [Emiliania huxleyi virus 156]